MDLDQDDAEDGAGMEERIEGQDYYAWASGDQPLDWMWDQPYALMCAIKYLIRCGRKGGPADAIKDLDKAVVYIRAYKKGLEKRHETDRATLD